MAVPKNKISKARRDKRRATYKLSVPGMIECPKCKALIRPHRICSACGFYKNREVVKVSE